MINETFRHLGINNAIWVTRKVNSPQDIVRKKSKGGEK